MSKLTINVNNHDQKYTVSEMRRRLAQTLSKLNGDQEVSFSFIATLENYRPARKCAHPNGFRDGICHHCQLLAKDALTIHQIEAEANGPVLDSEGYVRRTTMPAVLGAPYDLSNTSAFDGDVYEQAGLWKYAHSMDADPIEATKDQYQIFADLHGITRSEARARLLGHGYAFGGPVR